MPHKPIIKQQRLGRTERVEIGPNQQGVLYVKNQYRRILNPGDGLSLVERGEGGLALYVVDCGPHEANWRIDLSGKDLNDRFPVMIQLKYQVTDSARMVNDQVIDTEALIAHTLEPLLREQARQYLLNEFVNAETALKTILTPGRFTECGLYLHSADVVMNFTKEDLIRIEELNKLARAMCVPQQAEYSTELPTKEAIYKFQVNVIFTFKVINQKNLPTDTLGEAQDWLWRKIRPKLRPVSRQFTVNQIGEAEVALQEALENEAFSDHGLEIISAQIEIELDEQARNRAKELDARRHDQDEDLDSVRHETTLAEEQAKLDKIRRERALDHKKLAINFYAPYIEQGQWGLLALSLADNEMDANAVLSYLDEQQRSKLVLQLEFFKHMLEKDALPEDIAEKFTVSLLDELAKKALNAELPSLTASKEKEALPKPKEESKGEKVDKPDSDDKASPASNDSKDNDKPIDKKDET